MEGSPGDTRQIPSKQQDRITTVDQNAVSTELQIVNSQQEECRGGSGLTDGHTKNLASAEGDEIQEYVWPTGAGSTATVDLSPKGTQFK